MFTRAIHKLRTYFVTGLLVVLPLVVSIKVLVWVVTFLDGILKPVVLAFLNNVMRPALKMDDSVTFYIFGIGLLLTVALTMAVGVFAQNYFGRKMVDLVERIFDRLPFIRVVYSAVKQLLEPFNTEKGYSLKQVVLVEYPMKERYCVGLLANEHAGHLGGDTLVSVFIPTNHLHLGYLVLMPERDVVRVDMTVEEALKLTVSCGIVIPRPLSVQSLCVK